VPRAVRAPAWLVQPVHHPALVGVGSAGFGSWSPSADAYHQTNLVSDLPVWASSPTPTWSTLGPGRRGDHAGVGGRQRHRQGHLDPGVVHGSPIGKAPLVVTIPGGAPTGQVFNPTPGSRSGPARGPAVFLFDSEAGLVSGWNPGVPPPRPRPRPSRSPTSATPATRAWPSPPPRPAACCTPLTSTAGGSTSSTRAGSGSGCRAGSATPSSPAAMGRSTSRSWAGGCRWPTPSRTPTTPARSPARAAASSTSPAPAASGWTGWSAGAS
jgi:hypothetical protein